MHPFVPFVQGLLESRNGKAAHWTNKKWNKVWMEINTGLRGFIPECQYHHCCNVPPKTSWTVLNRLRTLAIGKPERQVRKASHCGSKQQYGSRAAITLRVP